MDHILSRVVVDISEATVDCSRLLYASRDQGSNAFHVGYMDPKSNITRSAID